MSANEYYLNISQTALFYFNLKKKNGKVILHNGASTNHTHIMMSSVILMQNCEKKGVIHVDGTYKLIKNIFPVMVIGVTDIRGVFHLIAFCITSNEEETDFFEFFSGVAKQAKIMGIQFILNSLFRMHVRLGTMLLVEYFQMLKN